MAPINYHLGKFPPDKLEWERLIPLIGPANAGLARYDGLLSAIPNTHVLLSALTIQEAVLSSKIEGTVVTMGEVLEIEAGGNSEIFTQPKREDAEEVLNYRKAMGACIGQMNERPLSQHMIRGAHALLMEGVRGRDKRPGAFREIQNWIGPKGCSIEEARFVPISPIYVRQGMDNWEKYLNSRTEPDALIQLAILHAEFESLHPFEDGNGRLGRMLMPLFLFQCRLLSSPDFYMSGYLEKNREEYQNRLLRVSQDNDWTGWCSFFLKGIREQAAENEKKARSILSLYEKVKIEVMELTRSKHAIRAVDFIFQTPTFQGPWFMRLSGIPRPSAARILKILIEGDVLKTAVRGRGRRPGIFVFRDLINIAEGKDIF
jgi:Uncharacterized conserved protein